jgi:tetratricopeptide (TPR) repeat protein
MCEKGESIVAMKKLFSTCALFLLTLQTLAGQTLPVKGLPAIQSQSSQEAVMQTPEAAEVKKLNAEVIKLFNERKFDEALPIARRALKISEKTFGSNHLMVADVRTNLAALYLEKREYDEAESNYKRALSIYEKALGVDHRLVAKTLDRLASLRFINRDFEKAAELYERALSSKEKLLGREHAEVAEALMTLTEVYRKTHERGKAKPLFERILAIREKTFGPNHPKVAEVLEKFACALYAEGEQAEAEKVEARANSILYKEAAQRGEPVAPPADVFECKTISKPHPDLYRAARDMRWTGATTLKIAVIVDETGKVTSARFISGDKLFQLAAEKSAMSARFRPTLVDGQPVKVKGEIVYGYMATTRMEAVGPIRQ